MDIFIFIFGMLFCAASGVVDRNPTTPRMVTVLILYTVGIELITKSGVTG